MPALQAPVVYDREGNPQSLAVKHIVVTRRVVDVASLYRDIGAKLRHHRERAKCSQEQLGIALGMTRANVANLEAGKTRILLEHIYNAALTLKIDVRELLP